MTRWQASTPKRSWTAATARNVPRTSSSGTSGATSLVHGGPEIQRLERGAMDRRVLADLERGEVESERADLPAKVGDLAPGDPVEAVRDERLLELGQLRVELDSAVVVPAGARGRLARSGPPGSDAAARR